MFLICRFVASQHGTTLITTLEKPASSLARFTPKVAAEGLRTRLRDRGRAMQACPVLDTRPMTSL